MREFVRSLTGQIFFALILGVACGFLLGTKALPLGIPGRVLIQAIKTLAVPLIFFAIIDAILTTQMRWSSARHLLTVILVNTFFAAFIGLSLSNFFEPGKLLSVHLSATSAVESKFRAFEGKSLLDSLGPILPTNFVDPFQSNAVITVVLLAVIFGLAAKVVRSRDLESQSLMEGLLRLNLGMLRIFEQLLRWTIKLIPIGIFGVTAKTVGEYGLSPLRGLLIYVALALLGLLLQVILVYHGWLVFYVRMNLKKFWGTVQQAVVYAIGTNSSLATLPVTLKVLDDLKISSQSARLGACVATNLNNDGILLYEAMAALMIAQAAGIHLSLSQQIEMTGLAILAAIGITGVPEAGLISLSLVLSSVGLPLDWLPILMTVDWIIARGRSVVNVLSDITVSVVIDKMGKPS